MHDGERAFRALLEDWKDDPDFVAEGIAVELSSAINSALKSRKMTQKQLAEKIQVSAARISQIMSGNLNLTLLTMCKVALGVGLHPKLEFLSNERQAMPMLAGAAGVVSWTQVATAGRPVYSTTLPYVAAPIGEPWAHYAVEMVGGIAPSGFATTAPELPTGQSTGLSPIREKGAAA